MPRLERERERERNSEEMLQAHTHTYIPEFQLEHRLCKAYNSYYIVFEIVSLNFQFTSI